MRTRVRSIGNSKGVILPKGMLNKCAIDEEVDVEVKNHQIIITPVLPDKRKGWESAFKRMAEAGDDELVIPEVFMDDSIDDWTWK